MPLDLPDDFSRDPCNDQSLALLEGPTWSDAPREDRDESAYEAFVHDHLCKMRSLECTSGSDQLAVDAMLHHYAAGLHLRRLSNGGLLRYDGRCWRDLLEPELRAVLRPMAMQNPGRYGGSTGVVAAVGLIRDLAPDVGQMLVRPPRPIVNTLTGELWIGPDGLIERREHRPQSRLRYVLPVAYDPDARSPLFDRMLTQIFAKATKSEELIDFLLELFGYAIQPVRDIPTILFLWGNGSNGKSTLLKILMAVLGPELVHAGSLATLFRDRFLLATLANRLVFLEDDARDGLKLDDGLIKKICETKQVDTRPLRSSTSISYCSMLMPIVALNGTFQLDDISGGMQRRTHVIPFDQKFEKNEMDLGLADRIIASELPGVLNRLLQGLSRLRARGYFAPPPDSQRALQGLMVASNPLLSFLDEMCVRAPDARVGLRELYQTFVSWMQLQGQARPFPERGLKVRLQAMGFTVRKNSIMCVEGLALRGSGLS